MTSASGAGNTASYTYDAQGRRKTKTVNGTTTVFVTDAGNREVLEYDGASGAIQRWYAYGLGSNDVLNQMNIVAGTRAMLVPDIQGSIIGSQDSSTGTLSKIGYLPFGKSANPPGTFGYTAQRIDPETNGLYYYRARHYSPAWGRFLQTDPIGYSGGNNLYAYVENDPLNLIDPFGFDKDRGSGGGQLLAGFALAATTTCVVAEPCGAAAWLGILGTAAVLGGVLMSGDTPKEGSPANRGADTGGTPQGPDDPNLGNLNKVSNYQLLQAARRDGYDSIEDWKTLELQLNSRSNIVKDSQGNLYSVPRQGGGTPQSLGVKLP